MTEKNNSPLRLFRTSRILIPVLLGLSVSVYLIFKDFNVALYTGIDWTFYTGLSLFIAICMMAVRDIGYMYRIRLLTGKQLSWRRSFDVIFLWEFASSLTPSIVGGSAVALFIVNREGISAGKSTAIVMVTALLDELFYVTMVPLVILIVGTERLFVGGHFMLFNMVELGSREVFLIGYVFILVLSSIISYAVFFRPRGFKWILLKIFRMRWLQRWRYQAIQIGDDIILTSKEMKGKSFVFWVRAYLSTWFSWTARFWVVNFLILTVTNTGEHLLIYARQLVMWVILLISPTPGSSGIAEYIFPKFLGDFTGAYSDAVALSWRFISYYPYLIIGSIILPIWIRRVYRPRKK